MSSTTTNLGLTKPAYADEADIAVINGNMDLLDAAYGAINQSTMRPVPFAIAVSDWEAVTGGFSATYNSAYITTTSQEILTYTKSIENATAHIDAEKKSGGGGLVFTSAKKPTGTVQGTAYVFDNDDRTLPVIIEGTVTPIANGGTGQSSLAGAQSALGITALSEQKANITVELEMQSSTFALTNGGSGQVTKTVSMDNYNFVDFLISYNGLQQIVTVWCGKTQSSEYKHISITTSNTSDGNPRIFVIDFKISGRYITDLHNKYSSSLSAFADYTGTGMSIIKVWGRDN